MSNRQMLEGALKRVNAKAGANGKLYHDNTGWFIRNLPYKESRLFDESSMSAGELLAYLHGLEDALLFINNKEK